MLLSLIGAGINNRQINLPIDAEDINWQRVIKEAALQAVTLMAVDTAAQNKLTQLLDKHNKPYVILKGTAAASYYPVSSLRHLGDVDFLIDSKYKDEISQLLISEGYESHYENHTCHVVFQKANEYHLQKCFLKLMSGRSFIKNYRYLKGNNYGY